MKYSWSAEVYKSASDAILQCARKIETILAEGFSSGSLSDLDMELRYVPIVMPMESHLKYKERSKCRLKQRIYDCAPHLDYETFVSGSYAAQIEEFIRGMKTSAPYLTRFGASDKQVAEFEEVLVTAARQPDSL
ncbi:hypothetical protein [Sphingomonas sp. GC_Shp_3]|uniref:hypothetical protein n=1 Tax=Sphingomonas sp. GC_Shp_3 TaxID=2937383 RepID=UPI00226ABD06|nr:hypothetical protein [Sphingomonas sp. GC_Shp_3]